MTKDFAGTEHGKLVILEKYERLVNYIYPILQSCPRKHGVLRDKILQALLSQVDLLTAAAKTNQISKVHVADAGLVSLRFLFRLALAQRIITTKQEVVALKQISEVGKMIGSWLKTFKSSGQKG